MDNNFCQKCEKFFYSKQSRDRHVKRYHNNDAEPLRVKVSSYGGNVSPSISSEATSLSDDSTENASNSDNESDGYETDEESKYEVIDSDLEIDDIETDDEMTVTDEDVDETSTEIEEVIADAIQKKKDIDTEAWNLCQELMEQCR